MHDGVRLDGQEPGSWSRSVWVYTDGARRRDRYWIRRRRAGQRGAVTAMTLTNAARATVESVRGIVESTAFVEA